MQSHSRNRLRRIHIRSPQRPHLYPVADSIARIWFFNGSRQLYHRGKGPAGLPPVPVPAAAAPGQPTSALPPAMERQPQAPAPVSLALPNRCGTSRTSVSWGNNARRFVHLRRCALLIPHPHQSHAHQSAPTPLQQFHYLLPPPFRQPAPSASTSVSGSSASRIVRAVAFLPQLRCCTAYSGQIPARGHLMVFSRCRLRSRRRILDGGFLRAIRLLRPPQVRIFPPAASPIPPLRYRSPAAALLALSAEAAWPNRTPPLVWLSPLHRCGPWSRTSPPEPFQSPQIVKSITKPLEP